MAIQTKTGKAFEYALLKKFYQRLRSPDNNVIIFNSEPYQTAKSCFENFSEDEQGLYSLVSSAAKNFLVDIEPRLSNSINPKILCNL